MAEPYVGEIRMVGFQFAPVGWAFCDGSQLFIAQNDVLFSLIGTTYGGDGVQHFNLPDLRSRVPMHQGNGFIIGQQGGAESVVLTSQQLGGHSHPAIARSAPAAQTSPANAYFANSGTELIYATDSTPGNLTAMNAAGISAFGSNQPHENRMAFQCINFIIALAGLFPSRD